MYVAFIKRNTTRCVRPISYETEHIFAEYNQQDTTFLIYLLL